ncbi:bifunctional adenosylcobinamide kinase/adenosylcobinamide-phosphate guanylyltransferase [Marinobacterium aestuarii]|uniref:Bifunctional adenosylcobalamin biosynthesis protein n=1 Tax=Marinobacterium aestuarii TaxID=1821621 RepID=A0A1A9EX02_9GAMM|nr:bifunctional adenosylcobinamide kinase/adenosylcobinamide-phosphate guanylyltransferase [Marinobacterium aestuarii]ANG62069.1 bifunctional adenosylcobinamide kinase/adenosylcobinamide-phosphate guanylyltransferase [Marinobacterium aestuarii]
MKQLILGGARSGKSRLAEQRAQATGLPVALVVTMVPGNDTELAERVRRHQADRPADWRLVEAPIALAAALDPLLQAGYCVLVDCLTLWLTNLLLLECDETLQAELDALDALLARVDGSLIMVSNEVGLGIVPMGALSRRFQDQTGWLHQRMAAICDRVTLSVAGLPLEVK